MINVVKVNYIIDILMLFLFIIVTATSVILWFQEENRGYHREFYFRGHNIKEIHKWSGLIFILFLTLHLFLHTKWITTMTKQIIFKDSKKLSKKTSPK